MLRALAVCGSLVAIACGSSEPDPPLILGPDGARAAPGPRTLTSSQSRALQRKITAAGERCDEVAQTYLRDVTAGAEAWEVRCSDGAYTVLLSSDGAPGLVRPCVEAPFDAPLTFANATTLRETLRHVRERTWSSCRVHPEAETRRAADTAERRLLEEGADLDAPVDAPVEIRLVVGRLPG